MPFFLYLYGKKDQIDRFGFFSSFLNKKAVRGPKNGQFLAGFFPFALRNFSRFRMVFRSNFFFFGPNYPCIYSIYIQAGGGPLFRDSPLLSGEAYRASISQSAAQYKGGIQRMGGAIGHQIAKKWHFWPFFVVLTIFGQKNGSEQAEGLKFGMVPLFWG